MAQYVKLISNGEARRDTAPLTLSAEITDSALSLSPASFRSKRVQHANTSANNHFRRASRWGLKILMAASQVAAVRLSVLPTTSAALFASTPSEAQALGGTRMLFGGSCGPYWFCKSVPFARRHKIKARCPRTGVFREGGQWLCYYLAMLLWLWIFISVLSAAAACGLTYILTRLRMEKSSLQQAQSLAEALAALANERRVFEETAKAIEEGTKRKALEEFLATMRVEERHYIRQNRFLFAHRKSLIMQERIFFRNIPLSNWVEHEVPIEEGADLNDVAKTLSVFSAVEEQAIPRRVRLPFLMDSRR